MKVKVKGLVFVGAAAAILLSAGAANAAKTDHNEGNPAVVTSQKYSDQKYEWVSDKIIAQSTQAILGGRVSGTTSGSHPDDEYPSLSAMKQYTNSGNSGELATMGTNGLYGTHIVTHGEATTENGAYEWKTGYNGSEERVPSEKAVIKALDALAEDVGGATAKQPEIIAADSDKLMIGYRTADDPTTENINESESGWGTLVGDASGSGAVLTSATTANGGLNYSYVAVVQDATNPEQYTVGINKDKVETSGTNVNATTNGAGNKLVTASAVQMKMDKSDHLPYVGKDNEWKVIAGDAGNGTLSTGQQYVSIHTENDGTFKVGLDNTTVKAYSTTAADNRTLTSNSQKLVTEGVLDANVRLGAKATNNGATPSVDNGKLVYIGTDGLIEKSTYEITTNSGSGVTSSDTQVPTSLAVKNYVKSQFGNVEASYDTNCDPSEDMPNGVASLNCALVLTRTGTNAFTLTWKEMAGGQTASN